MNSRLNLIRWGSWQTRAACEGSELNRFFPGPGNCSDEAAKAICRTCPVLLECRAWAIDNKERYGVWGGLNEQERREILAQERQERAEKVSA